MADDGEKVLKQTITDLLLEMKLRKYLTVEERISTQEHIFNDCPSFFILIHLKLQCIFKQLTDHLRLNKDNTKFTMLQIDRCINRAKTELSKLIELSNESSVQHFEIIIRLYLQFAYINSIIAKRKNDIYDCLSFTCIALNLMKIFLENVPYPNEIRTYYYYLLNMLFVSELLIEDSDYETAKVYQFNCLQIAVQALCLINNEDLLYHPYFKKMIETIAITLIHRGVCNENLGNYKQALEDYKQSRYFSSFLDVEEDDMFLNELCSKVKEVAFNTFGDAIEKPMPKGNNKPIPRLTVTTKNERLFNIVNGFSYNIKKIKQKEKDIEKKLFIKRENQRDYLVEFIDDHVREYKHLSPDTKSNLAHYSLYSKLLSTNYKDFVAMTSNFEYDNPTKQKENIELIERYINSKIDVSNNEVISTPTPTHIPTSTPTPNTNDTPLPSNLNTNTNTKNNWLNPSHTNTNTNYNTYMTTTETNFNGTTTNDNHYYTNSTKPNIAHTNTNPKYLSTSQSFFSNKPSIKSKSSSKATSFNFKDIKLKKEDMYILSNHFNAKLNHLDQLSTKELEFQKMMLKLKLNNRAIHHDCETKDLSQIEEDARKSFSRLKLKASENKKHHRGYSAMIIQTSPNMQGGQRKGNIANAIKNSISIARSNSKGDIRQGSDHKRFSIRKRSQKEDIGLLYKKAQVRSTNNDKLIKLDQEINDIVYYMGNINKINDKNTRNRRLIKSLLTD